ncbi:MAG: hypothetical protein NT015_05490 [Alphaproteobacteria bacterium]|nr:hypothetical protein [Alphaproteobacteria bacterium]
MIAGLLFATAVGFCTPQATVSPAEAVDRYISAYNAHDLTAIQETYSEGVRVHVWRESGAADSYQIMDVIGGIGDFYRENPDVQVAASQRALLGTRVAQVETYTTESEALVIYTVVEGCVVARDTYW